MRYQLASVKRQSADAQLMYSLSSIPCGPLCLAPPPICLNFFWIVKHSPLPRSDSEAMAMAAMASTGPRRISSAVPAEHIQTRPVCSKGCGPTRRHGRLGFPGRYDRCATQSRAQTRDGIGIRLAFRKRIVVTSDKSSLCNARVLSRNAHTSRVQARDRKPGDLGTSCHS